MMAALALSVSAGAQTMPQWPDVNPEAKPAARWWWLGSAVDEKNLTGNLEEYASKGMGSLEITPIYGVQNNEANNVAFLSPRWMELLKYTIAEGKRLGICIDMNTGTGWPFGGPEVGIEDAASKVVFEECSLRKGEKLTKALQVTDPKQKDAVLERVMAFGADGKVTDLTNKVDKNGMLNWKAGQDTRIIVAFCGKTYQKVKRAAPGGEGYVMNHFSRKSVDAYLNRFEKAFKEAGIAFPHNFFNDSYEVYQADWTPGLFDEFRKRRGYKLEEHLPDFLGDAKNEQTRRLIADYRETLGDMLLENFTANWTAWAERNGSKTRNQAHGSPGNLIDLYAAVGVPECESFGISDFGIRGLRKDSLFKENDADLTMLKYASSAAHIAGKPFVSSETFTWLTEHFRTSLAQCKPDLDLMFLSGVNHAFFHGTPYSPLDAEWPGWLFYASVNMSPTNSIWRDTKPFFDYIARCQSFLQWGKPDNDFLVYYPVYDMWHEQEGRLLMFDIHKMKQRAPEFIHTVSTILNNGYDVDYISDRFLRDTRFENGRLVTSGGESYQALIIPGVRKMPADVVAHLNKLAEAGARIVYVNNYPADVPGLAQLDKRRGSLAKELKRLPAVSFDHTTSTPLGKGAVITGTDFAEVLALCGGKQETMKLNNGLSCIRRKNDNGYHYFISALSPQSTDGWIPLGVKAEQVMIYDPMTGRSGVARSRNAAQGTEVYAQLESGASLIVVTSDKPASNLAEWKYPVAQGTPVELKNGWNLSFVQSQPAIEGVFAIDTLCSWTALPVEDASVNMGTATYTVQFDLSQQAADWKLSLGEVCESARVRINDQEVGTAWSVPFELYVGNALKPGRNVMEVEVTNLPANRIADYDRRQIPWRRFNEINIVNLQYKKDSYGNWQTVPSGLLGPVTLTPCNYQP